MQDELAVYYYSNKLIEEYSASNACDLLKACWLMPEDDMLQSETFERIVFVQGNDEEVYSALERSYISTITQQVFYYDFTRNFNNSFVRCRISVLSIPGNVDYYEYSIALLKIINKAIEGFHFVFFVTPEGILPGCSKFAHDDGFDFFLSPIWGEKMDWKELYYLFLFRSDDDSFLSYYRELHDLINDIPRCFFRKTDVDERKDFYSEAYYQYCHCDDEVDDLTEYYSFYYEPGIEESELFDFDGFVRNIAQLNESLSCIKTNKINSLEMLFEAEEKHMNDSSTPNVLIKDDVDTSNYLTEKFIDDPIELLKMIKNEKGIQ